MDYLRLFSSFAFWLLGLCALVVGLHAGVSIFFPSPDVAVIVACLPVVAITCYALSEKKYSPLRSAVRGVYWFVGFGLAISGVAFILTLLT